MPPSRLGPWILPPPRASTRYARSDPRAATAALGAGKIHGPSLGGGIMYQCYFDVVSLLCQSEFTYVACLADSLLPSSFHPK
jgi:hypothetical protein